MNEDEKRQYAAWLIDKHARDVEFLSIFEMSEEYQVNEISDADANDVADLINRAKVGVSW